MGGPWSWSFSSAAQAVWPEVIASVSLLFLRKAFSWWRSDKVICRGRGRVGGLCYVVSVGILGDTRGLGCPSFHFCGVMGGQRGG